MYSLVKPICHPVPWKRGVPLSVAAAVGQSPRRQVQGLCVSDSTGPSSACARASCPHRAGPTCARCPPAQGWISSRTTRLLLSPISTRMPAERRSPPVQRGGGAGSQHNHSQCLPSLATRRKRAGRVPSPLCPPPRRAECPSGAPPGRPRTPLAQRRGNCWAALWGARGPPPWAKRARRHRLNCGRRVREERAARTTTCAAVTIPSAIDGFRGSQEAFGSREESAACVCQRRSRLRTFVGGAVDRQWDRTTFRRESDLPPRQAA